MGRIFSYLKIWHLAVILLIVSLPFLFYLSRRGMQATRGSALKGMTAFAGGKFEASGVTNALGTDGLVFVDNGQPGKVFLMRLDEGGKQVDAIRPVNLGVDIEDIEGITTDGTYFYVVSSQARPKAAEKEGLVRFKLNSQSQSVEGVESVRGLKRFLLENVAELREDGKKKGKHGGLNIEGIAWDPRRGRLLLGLRSPIDDDEYALLVPLRLRDPKGALSFDNLEVVDSKLIRLPLGGLGIRGIEYDARKNAFLIITGASEDQERTDFVLWEWNGDESQPALKETARFDDELKPEGVARVVAGGRDVMLVVFDSGGYRVME